MLLPKSFQLGRVKMLSLVDKLETNKGPAVSLYLPFDLPVEEIKNSLADMPDAQAILPNLTELATGSKTGVILFWGTPYHYLILPPFPVTERLSDGVSDVWWTTWFLPTG